MFSTVKHSVEISVVICIGKNALRGLVTLKSLGYCNVFT